MSRSWEGQIEKLGGKQLTEYKGQSNLPVVLVGLGLFWGALGLGLLVGGLLASRSDSGAVSPLGSGRPPGAIVICSLILHNLYRWIPRCCPRNCVSHPLAHRWWPGLSCWNGWEPLTARRGA
jgi:hypothetical protein